MFIIRADRAEKDTIICHFKHDRLVGDVIINGRACIYHSNDMWAVGKTRSERIEKRL